MKSKTKKLRQKECLGKVRFESMGRAQKAARAYWHSFGQKMNGYKCSFCDGYHIGHKQ